MNKETKDQKIHILALSWRDIKAPKHGGAEVQTHEMLRRADHDRFEITHFSPMFEGAESEEVIDGVRYLRAGSLLSVIGEAKKYYKKHAEEIDFVIDQCNTHRFFTSTWVPQEKRIFYIHQLTREIWDINLKFPLNKIGKALETKWLRMNRKDYTIALSESTKQDLVDVGFDPEKIFIIPIGLPREIYSYAENAGKLPVENKGNDFVYVGRYSPYKGMDVCIRALAQVKKTHSDARLWIVGKKDPAYIESDLRPLCEELGLTLADVPEDGDVLMFGFVTEEKKYQLEAEARALLFPSIREGWGIIVTEAGYLGTPSVGYDAPGVRDALDYGRSGYMTKENDVDHVTQEMLRTIEAPEEYRQKSLDSMTFARQFNWDENGKLFGEIIDRIMREN